MTQHLTHWLPTAWSYPTCHLIDPLPQCRVQVMTKRFISDGAGTLKGVEIVGVTMDTGRPVEVRGGGRGRGAWESGGRQQACG